MGRETCTEEISFQPPLSSACSSWFLHFPNPDGDPGGVLSVKPLPLPGQIAWNFEVAAVVGEEINKIKLSDFQGRWVYLTFIPAAFTFV